METADLQNQSFSSDNSEHPPQQQTSSQNPETTRPDETHSHSRSGSLSSAPQVKKDNKEKEKEKEKETQKKSKPKVVMNISDTRYDVVRYVGKKLLNFKVTKEPEVEWDMFWTDNAVQPEALARMQPFQKINHFPGMYSLARKNHLGRNLMRMKKAFPENYKFFPQTYLLPAEYSEFKMQFSNKNKSKTFIVKPEASCQGRGIFLTRTGEEVLPGEHYVAQRYLHKPFLLDGLKFDLRIYVLLAGSDPLRIYLFDDGLGRFATEEYIAPTAANLENMCMHLTNYAINKDNPNFVFNESAEKNDVGHKRSLKAVFKSLEEKGHDVKAIWNDIKKIIVKTLCSVQPILAHSYKSCQPDEPYNNMCFELLGFDVMLDHKLKPWLIEVNHTPSFTTDTPLDKTIKRNVIRDALVLMNVNAENRIKYKNKKKIELQQRVLTGKKPKVSLEERQAIHAKAQQERDEWESKNLGGFEKIFPFDDPSKAEEDYGEFIKAAQKWWEEWTGTTAKKVVKKTTPANENKLPPMNFGSGAPTGVSQNVRAKEIQNVYSQKMKLGSTTLKVPSSQQKARVNTASTVSNVNPAETSNDTAQKSQVKAVASTIEDIQPWANPLEQYNVVGEDEADYFEEMGPIREEPLNDVGSGGEEDDIEDAGLGQLEMKFPGRMALGENSHKNTNITNLSTTTEIINLSNTQVESAKISTFRIKRGSGYDGPKESPCRTLQSRSDKENSKAASTVRKPEFRTGPIGKTATIQSASNSMYLSKAPEKLAEVYGVKENTSDKTVRATKAPLKLGNGVFGAMATPDEYATTGNEAEFERKAKSAAYLSLGRISNQKNGVGAKGQNKKLGLNLAPQFKDQSNGNFLVPRVFELNIQGMKPEQSKDNTVYSGLKSFGRSLSKGLIIPRDNHSSAVSACLYDGQFNTHKTIV